MKPLKLSIALTMSFVVIQSANGYVDNIGKNSDTELDASKVSKKVKIKNTTNISQSNNVNVNDILNELNTQAFEANATITKLSLETDNDDIPILTHDKTLGFTSFSFSAAAKAAKKALADKLAADKIAAAAAAAAKAAKKALADKLAADKIAAAAKFKAKIILDATVIDAQNLGDSIKEINVVLADAFEKVKQIKNNTSINTEVAAEAIQTIIDNAAVTVHMITGKAFTDKLLNEVKTTLTVTQNAVEQAASDVNSAISNANQSVNNFTTEMNNALSKLKSLSGCVGKLKNFIGNGEMENASSEAVSAFSEISTCLIDNGFSLEDDKEDMNRKLSNDIPPQKSRQQFLKSNSLIISYSNSLSA